MRPELLKAFQEKVEEIKGNFPDRIRAQLNKMLGA